MCGLSQVSFCNFGDNGSLKHSQKVQGLARRAEDTIAKLWPIFLASKFHACNSSHLTLPPPNGNPLRRGTQPACSSTYRWHWQRFALWTQWDYEQESMSMGLPLPTMPYLHSQVHRGTGHVHLHCPHGRKSRDRGQSQDDQDRGRVGTVGLSPGWGLHSSRPSTWGQYLMEWDLAHSF